MYFAVDDRHRLAFFRFVSAELSDEQWMFYVDGFVRYASMEGGPYAIVAESELGSAMPNAKWRQRFADAGARVHSDAVFVLITKSAVARGIVTAVNWLRPFRFHYGVVASRQEATRFVCGYRPDPGVSAALEAAFLRAPSAPVGRDGRWAAAPSS